MVTTEHEPRRPSYQDLLAAYARARETWERTPDPHTLAVLETGLQFLLQELQRPGKFEMGQLVMTPGAHLDMTSLTPGSSIPGRWVRHR
jgi:hypothetical protein